MTGDLSAAGFQLRRRILSASDTQRCRKAADAVATAARQVNVRDACAKSPHFAALARSPQLISLLPTPMSLVRSILFDKRPGHNWPVAWHQDLTIAVRERLELPGYGPWSVKDGVTCVQPPIELLAAMVTIRVHLDACGTDNGALRVIPGSHRHGRLSAAEIASFAETGPVDCICEAGDVLLMRPLLLHESKRAQLPSQRRILHLEYAPRELLHPRLRWHEAP